jgi:hypothetical protein
MPEREELLCRDQVPGVVYSTEGAKKMHWSKSIVLHEMQYTLLTLYVLFALLGSLFFEA